MQEKPETQALSPVLLGAVSQTLSSVHKLLLLDLSSLDITNLTGFANKGFNFVFPLYIFSQRPLNTPNFYYFSFFEFLFSLGILYFI